MRRPAWSRNMATSAKSLPRARGHWLLGSAREMRDRPHSFVAELGAAHGGIARFRILHRRMIAVTQPDLIRQVLVLHHDRYERSFHYHPSRRIIGHGLLTTDGAFWKQRRRQVQPAFRPDTLPRLVPGLEYAAAMLFSRWDAAADTGTAVPINADLQAFALAVICRSLLSVGIEDAEADRFAAAVRDSLYLVRRHNTSLCPMPHWVPNRTNRELGVVRDVLDAFVTQHLRARFETGAPVRSDIAQALLEARDPESGEPLSWQGVLDETKTLFTAGFETSATMLTWALHELSQHADVAARWHAEIDAVLAGRPPTWDDLPRLVYCDQVVQETLRLHPPVYSLGRTCIADDELGGYAIRPGETLLLSVYGAHRDPAFWPEPLRFDPERFAAGRTWTRHAFLPFAMGKHTCLGNSFAIAEAVLGLAAIGQRYSLAPTVPYDVPVRAQVTLVPAVPIELRLQRR